MISSTTPYKLAEIIRDTWPQLYRPLQQPVDSGTIEQRQVEMVQFNMIKKNNH
jgi:hypothetical protein